MGYTHYWNNDNLNELSTKCIADLNRLLSDYNHLIQFEDDTPKPPVLNEYHVRFNGIGDDGHETFYFETEYDDDDGLSSFCKTAHKPYDVVVVAALGIIYLNHPDEFKAASDGDLEELREGLELAAKYASPELKAIESVPELIEFSTNEPFSL